MSVRVTEGNRKNRLVKGGGALVLGAYPGEGSALEEKITTLQPGRGQINERSKGGEGLRSGIKDRNGMCQKKKRWVFLLGCV